MIDTDKLIRKLEIYSRSNICDSHNGCPYVGDENTNCENCGAIGALEIVKEEVED